MSLRAAERTRESWATIVVPALAGSLERCVPAMTEEDRDKTVPEEATKEDAGVEIGMGEPNSFEPEEDSDAAEDPTP